jgi:hypothetical protein
MVGGAELYQLYVSAQSRGSDIAAVLMPMPRLGYPKAASERPGSRAQSEMSEPQDSTKNADGIGLE